MAIKNDKKHTYFILKCCRIRVVNYVKLLLLILTVALFVERYCFAVALYKTKNYGYILILLVVFCNAIFLYAIKQLRKKKQQKRLHTLYNIERAPKVGIVVIIFVG